MTLTRDQIVRAEDRKRELVSVPEWGGSVYVGSMTGKERDEFEMWANSLSDGNGKIGKPSNIRARLACMTIVDENHTRLFSLDDMAILGERNAAALDRIFDAAMRVNRMGKAEADTIAEGFSASRNGSSIAVSHSPSDTALPSECLPT